MDTVNTMNVSTNNSVVDFDDVFVVGIWSLLLIYGLITNLLTLVGISRSQSLRKSTSYWLICSVSFCDIMMIIISLTHLLPATLLHDWFVEITDYRNVFAIFMYNIFWYSAVVQLAGMAVNRYVSIVHSLYYRQLFTPCYTVMFLSFMYTVGIAVSLPALFPCCYMIYDHQLWLTYFTDKDTDYYLVDLIIDSLSLAIMIVCYAAILWKVRKSQASIRRHQTTYGGIPLSRICKNLVALSQQTKPHASGQPSRREMKLLTQFLIVSVVFLLTFLMWQWLFKLPSTSKWIYFTTTTFFFINNAVNPTVYLIYNTSLRKELSNLFSSFCSKKRDNKTVQIRIRINDAQNDRETSTFIRGRSSSAGSAGNSGDSESITVDERFINHARFASLPGVPYYLDKALSEQLPVQTQRKQVCLKLSIS